MKKVIKIFSLPLMVTPTILFASCNKCQHEASDELVSLFAGDRIGAMYKCKHCDETVYVDHNPTPEVINMPTLYLNGDFTGMTKDNKKKLQFRFENNPTGTTVNCYCTAKWQGNATLEYPKKNLNIQLFEDEECEIENEIKLLDGFVKTFKYSFKANYFDSANIRNIMLSNMAETVYEADKANLPDFYQNIPHYGLVSGYQIVLYCNDIFWGTYNLTTKKDKDMWKTTVKPKTTPKAVIVADDYTASTQLNEPIAADFSNGWEVEYYDKDDPEGKEKAYEKIVTSFNTFIHFINNTSIEDFLKEIDDYSNLESLIDYLILVQAFALEDNWAKNMIWVTYDYNKWYPFLYDLDSTIGVNWFTLPVFPDAKFDLFKKNILFNKLWKSSFNKIKEKYETLRKDGGPLSNQKLSAIVDKYFTQSTKIALQSNKNKWSSAPYKGAESTSTFIKNWITTRLNWLDTHFNEN